MDTESLLKFRSCSTYCLDAVDPVLFRTLTLHNDTLNSQFHNNSFVQRILDPRDRLRCHVRCLELGPFKSNILPINPETIIQILNSLTNLKDFGWNLGYQMPSKIFITLYHKWPCCRIHLKPRIRLMKGQHPNTSQRVIFRNLEEVLLSE
jgi:hypothetical protein